MRVKFFGGPIDGTFMEFDPGFTELTVRMWQQAPIPVVEDGAEHSTPQGVNSAHIYNRLVGSEYYLYGGWK